jgi:hypothetical protein
VTPYETAPFEEQLKGRSQKSTNRVLERFFGEEAVEKSIRYRFQSAKKGVFGLFAILRVGVGRARN